MTHRRALLNYRAEKYALAWLLSSVLGTGSGCSAADAPKDDSGSRIRADGMTRGRRRARERHQPHQPRISPSTPWSILIRRGWWAHRSARPTTSPAEKSSPCSTTVLTLRSIAKLRQIHRVSGRSLTTSSCSTGELQRLGFARRFYGELSDLQPRWHTVLPRRGRREGCPLKRRACDACGLLSPDRTKGPAPVT